MNFEENEILVFQGDSITDGGRGRPEGPVSNDPNHYIGHSFPYLISAELAYKYIDKNPMFYSRGISGNDSLEMYARWRTDCINLNPTIINVLIGTNDAGKWIYEKGGSSPEQYDRILRMLIEDTKKELPNVRFVFCEPFYFDLDGSEKSKERFKDIKIRQEAVRKISDDYNCTFVPLQELLEQYAEKVGDPAKILWDGVHPTILGHSIIAEQWFEITKL